MPGFVFLSTDMRTRACRSTRKRDAMGKLTDIEIRNWIRAGERFEGRSDGAGLALCWPKRYAAPFWKFRYRFQGKQQVMHKKNNTSLSLAKSREESRMQAAKVALGYD